MASTRARVVLPTPRGPHSRYPCATLPLAMAPRSVFETCDWTATSAKLFGRYLRASARDITRREYPRPDGATKDTACRCYLRGPDGVSGLAPSGTWGTPNIRHCGLRTNCYYELRTNCGLRTSCGLRATACLDVVRSQSVVSTQSEVGPQSVISPQPV